MIAAMIPPLGIAFIVIVAALVIGSIFWGVSRSGSLLEQWARSNGVRILHCERRSLFRGPFFWTTSKSQAVFYVTVEDAHGRLQHAYVRVGGYWLGMLSDNVDVRWE